MAPTPIPRYKAAVKKKPTFITGKNGARIQVNPDGSRYVIKKGTKAPGGRGTVQTGGQGTSAAQQIVNASLAPLLASIKQQEEAARAGNQREQDALSGFTKEIISYLQGSPAKINADYQGAIDTTDRLAQTAAEQFRMANPNAETQSDLSAIGAPEEQKAQLAAQNQSVFGNAAASLYRVGGQIPATMFAADQAANSAFANSLPDIQGLSARQALMKLLGDQREGMQKFAEQRAEIEGKRPQLVQEAQAAIDKSALDKAAFAMKIDKAQLDRDKYDLSVQKFNGDLAYKQANLSLSGQRLALSQWNAETSAAFRADAAGRDAANYYTDKSGYLTPKGYTRTAKGLVKIPGAKSGASLPTVPQIAKEAGNSAAKGVINKVLREFDPEKMKTDVTTQVAIERRKTQFFGSAMFRVIQAIGPQLKSLGYKPADVKVAAYTIVSGMITPPKGYKVPQSAPQSTTKNVSYTSTAKAQSVLAFASAQIGKPYVFGSGPGLDSFDCSDLIQAAYKSIGISLPRTTFDQINVGRKVTGPLQPGDLVFPARGHVALYIGDGKVIVAPRTGLNVRIQSVSDFRNILTARRVLPNQNVTV